MQLLATLPLSIVIGTKQGTRKELVGGGFQRRTTECPEHACPYFPFWSAAGLW